MAYFPKKLTPATDSTPQYSKNILSAFTHCPAPTGTTLSGWTKKELLNKPLMFKKQWLLNIESARSSCAQHMGFTYEPEQNAL
jgi:hypothetical protein